MKPLLRALAFAFASASLAVAQDAAQLTQNLQMQFTRSQVEQGQVQTLTTASYNFNLGMPVLQYGLGSLNVNGSENFERVPVGTGYASATGLNQVGANLLLFPNMPCQLSLHYSHTESLDLAGLGNMEGHTFGAGIFYNGPYLQNLRVSYSESTYDLGTVGETFSQWRADTSQHFGSTSVMVSASRQDYSDTTGTLDLTSTFLTVKADTRFSQAWIMRTYLESQDTTGLPSTLNLGVDLVGSKGPWTSITSVSGERASYLGLNEWDTTVSQSLTRAFGRVYLFGTLSGTTATGSSPTGGASLGESWRFTDHWSLNGDYSQTWGLGSDPIQGTGLDTHTLHVGVANNGDLPDLIKHALFFSTDRAFNQKVLENYPPGYIPADLATEFLQRRAAHQGTLTYSADFSRTQVEGGPGKLDLFSTTGSLGVRSGIQVLLMGDWTRDDGLSMPGVSTVSKDLNVSGSMRVGSSTLMVSGGVNSTSTNQPGDPLNGIPGFTASTSSHWSVGALSQLWGFPCGATLTAYEDSLNQRTKTLSTFINMRYGKVTFRVNVDEGYTAGGPRTSQITLSLVRWFDTIALRAPWNR